MQADKTGFTLIEIVIVMSISALVLMGGVVRYRQFNSRQTLKSVSQTFKNNLRDIQGKALTGTKPKIGYCLNNPLYIWRVNFPNTASFEAQAWCGTTVTGYQAAGDLITYQLPNGFYFDDGQGSIPARIGFLPLGEGAVVGGVLGGERYIRNGNSSEWYGICVSKSGDLEDCGYAETNPPTCNCEVPPQQID